MRFSEESPDVSRDFGRNGWLQVAKMVLSATSIRISPGLTNEHEELEGSPARPTELDIFSAAQEGDIATQRNY